ncbi:site-specific DNA-methyltransferase [Pseudomonas sp. PDNC002]|uniref:site-specific DNA-methyltransferase n=1 Tax=Pseudomonas sp. PDNC002 TaxID=2811422 RepID=UPI00196584AF|nr:site-specific DNA-methyltransferase [Pseudomonas sp. PDNC002]
MPRGTLNWSSGEQNPGSFQSANTDRTSENHHPTVKPTNLMAYLCRLITPPGSLVLDPFMGSGSTGKACMREGFRLIGIERDTDENGQSLGYIAIAAARISHAWEQAQHERAQGDLFGTGDEA